jgi:putative hemolysin
MGRIKKLKNKITRKVNRHYLRLNFFKPRHRIDLAVGSYIIRTATTKAEVCASLQLRHEVFFNEFRGVSHHTGLDIDRYDAFFDHLVVIEKKSGQVVATYRMHCGQADSDFYSASEFDMSELQKLQGPFLEMGRACIQAGYRRGVILNLLWRGIAEYLKVSGGQYLIGCGSIKTESAETCALLSTYLKEKEHVVKKLSCKPVPEYRLPDFHRLYSEKSTTPLSELEVAMAESLIPGLLKSYLKIGAQLFLEPAWDKEFKCVDYLVLLDREKIVQTYGKKYDL